MMRIDWRLPTDPGITASGVFDLRQPNEVNDLFPVFAGEKLFDLGISGAGNNDLGFSNSLLKIGPEMRKQVGKGHIEKLLVATEEIFGLHDAIKNRDFETFAYQVLGQQNRRTVTHIIGPLFETQADEAHLAFAGFKNHARGAH